MNLISCPKTCICQIIFVPLHENLGLKKNMKEYDFAELEVQKAHGDFLSIYEMRELLQQAPYKR